MITWTLNNDNNGSKDKGFEESMHDKNNNNNNA